MNINGYSSAINPYASVSNSQSVNGIQNIQSQNQVTTTLNDVANPSSQNSVNDFNVNISKEAIQRISEEAINSTQQPQPIEQNSAAQQNNQNMQVQQLETTQNTRQVQRTEQIQQEQQFQQMQPQFYQSPYGQVPISRGSIDIMV